MDVCNVIVTLSQQEAVICSVTSDPIIRLRSSKVKDLFFDVTLVLIY